MDEELKINTAFGKCSDVIHSKNFVILVFIHTIKRTLDPLSYVLKSSEH